MIASMLLGSAAAFAPMSFKGAASTQIFSEVADGPTYVMTDDYKSATIYGSEVANENIRNIAVM